MQKIKFFHSQAIMLLSVAINLIFPANFALATAELDVDDAEPAALANQTEPAGKAPVTQKIVPDLPDRKPIPDISTAGQSKTQTANEKEIFSFHVPPAVSGNVIPHIPNGLPALPPDTLFHTSSEFIYMPSASWRITARSLFEKPPQPKDIQLKLNAPSNKAFKLLQNQGNLPGWRLKDFSETARQIAFEFFEEEKPRTLIVVLKDVTDGCILKARVTPYATTNSITLSKNFLARVQRSIEMKDVL